MTPLEFKNGLLEFIVSAGFYHQISPWQITIVERMAQDYAMVTGQHTHTLANLPCTAPYIQPLDLCAKQCPAPAEKKSGWGCNKKKEENLMASYASAQIIADTTEKDQREYLASRLSTMKYEKAHAFEKQFGLTDDAAPQTAAEFVKRIADGTYTIDKEKMDKKTYDVARYIRWRNPATLEDRAGYDAAIVKLDEAYRTAKDAAILSPIAEAKTAMDAFKAWSL